MKLDRVAGAPISWGVCEVPGWGYQLAPERVLAEMRDVGLAACEFGPAGFLPADPSEKTAVLASYGLTAVGGFVPVVLHDPGHDPLPEVDREIDGFVAAGADVLVLAAVTRLDGYDTRPELDNAAWKTLLGNLDRIADHAAERQVRTALHPHVGTLVEQWDDVQRVLDGSQIPLCLDTGHLLIGGTEPLELARAAPERIAHTHLKDVDVSWARRVQSRAVTYGEAVRAGIYRPLGHGDVDIAGIVQTLEAAGYAGWYVIEQDIILPGPPAGTGPIVDVGLSVDFLLGVPE